ncbi:MAG: response regulator [Patescibacteria group bacterium]|nr:response regulator [Patescibacteria group bacterium]
MTNGKNKKILFVEDDLPTIEAVAFKLSQRGIIADAALNGEEAIERLKREKYDLVLLDLLLSKKSGFDVLREIKNNGQSKNAKIIVLSNLGQEDNMRKAMELGASDYIIKSDVNIHTLTERIINELK